ncbi:T9SS type A sorting domain-containing protein [Aquimarina litoralis]|uniref:T9SS type A sorting domain-containing protein n=1 Tax=Aquimarina litoralis TaxID=584605 RepID=UPI001C5A0395|nr:T9SS type A sorting domain-containing protein [Aquimarina litoralis]MBW1294197.1 T9SS type A sorting domain-containing protein [Aquimarina litoralis]
MRLQHIRSQLLILCGVLIPSLSIAQDLVSLNTSDLPFGSSIKGLYHLQEDNATGGFVYENGTILELTNNQSGIDYESSTFYFWIVENIEQNYFQIYSTTQDNRVLSIEQNGTVSWETYSQNTEPDVKTKLQFRMYADGTMRAEDSESVARGYITTDYQPNVTAIDNSDCQCNFLKIDDVSRFYVTPSGKGFSDYRAIVFEKSNTSNTNGSITEITNADGSSYTHIVQSNANNTANAYTFVSSKFQVSNFGTKDFQISISSGTEGEIGFLEYIRHDFEKNVFQGARPRLGIKVVNDEISLLYLDGDQDLPFGKELERELPTNIQVGIPFTLGFKDQYTMIASQNGVDYELQIEVPAEYFLNQSITRSARVLARMRSGDVKIAYTLEDGLIALNDAKGTDNGTGYVSTDPFMPYNDTGVLVNTFDWQESKWSVRYRGIGGTLEETVFSPYNSDELQEFHAINNQYDLTGNFIGGADNEYIEGWELIKANLGYSADGQPHDPAPYYPYVIMYDKMASKLRVFVYTSNFGESNQLTVELTAGGGIPNNGNNYAPKLWGGLQQFKSYDAIASSNYQQVVPFYSSEGRSWYYTDFVMEYDPCLVFFESFLRLSVIKTTQGSLTMVGRSQGGTVTSGTDEYDDWKNQREDFLLGAMQSDAATLQQGLGDITFNQFEEYDLLEFSEKLNGVLVGKEIADWEKEKARLEWEGTDQIADATIAEGSLLIAEGGYKVLEGGAGVFGATPIAGSAKMAQGATTIGRGAAKVVAGDGKAKMASAKKLYYESIKDKVKHSDQDIQIPVPEPRPQIVFGELALQGTLTISTNLTTENYIATPGGLNSGNAPEWWTSGTRGSEPLYNLPLGQFVMLEKPEFAVGVSKGAYDQYQAWLKIKEKPYFAHNDRVRGKVDDIITVAVSVETFNEDGYAVYSATSESYTTLFGQGYDNVLEGEHNISDLIKWSQIKENISGLSDTSDEAIQAKLDDWIRVSYEIWSITPSNIQSRNLKRVFGNSDLYTTGTTSFDFVSSSNAYYSDVLEDARSLADNLGTYDFVNNTEWGTDYHIYHSDYEEGSGSFYQKMDTYCNQLNSNVVGREQTKTKEPEVSEKPIIENNIGLKVYPNPVKDIANFLVTSPVAGQVRITLFDISGNLLIETTDMMDGVRNLEGKINVGNLSSGIYVLRIVLPNNEVITKKVVK